MIRATQSLRAFLLNPPQMSYDTFWRCLVGLWVLLAVLFSLDVISL